MKKSIYLSELLEALDIIPKEVDEIEQIDSKTILIQWRDGITERFTLNDEVQLINNIRDQIRLVSFY